MKVFIVLPRFDFSGPIKGAVAIANFLCKYYPTTIIFLKKNNYDYRLELDKRINIYCLGRYNYFSKFNIARRLIRQNQYERSILFSMCFSADIFSLLLGNYSFKISSIRSNLIKNYSYTYSFLGFFLAYTHLYIQNLFNLTIVMNNEMFKQVKSFSRTKIISLNNFIEENKLLEVFKKNIPSRKRISFIYVGGLNKRKDPFALIKAFEKICYKNNFILHIIGNGPLFKKLHFYVKKKNLNNYIILHGFLRNPYELLSESDVFVLPSHSEGTPRAAMEALFLGIPCVLRNVEGNNELVDKKLNNGELFDFDYQLPDVLLKVSQNSRKRLYRKNLLPKKFSAKIILGNYKILVNNIFYKKKF